MEKIIDSFKWEIVPYNKAKECKEQLYILYSDGSEAEVECDADIKRACGNVAYCELWNYLKRRCARCLYLEDNEKTEEVIETTKKIYRYSEI